MLIAFNNEIIACQKWVEIDANYVFHFLDNRLSQSPEYDSQTSSNFENSTNPANNVECGENDPCVTKIEKITSDIQLSVEKLKTFQGTKESKEYKLLDEMFSRSQLALDSIETDNDHVRAKRKACVESINQCLHILDSKATSNATMSDIFKNLSEDGKTKNLVPGNGNSNDLDKEDGSSNPSEVTARFVRSGSTCKIKIIANGATAVAEFGNLTEFQQKKVTQEARDKLLSIQKDYHIRGEIPPTEVTIQLPNITSDTLGKYWLLPYLLCKLLEL